MKRKPPAEFGFTLVEVVIAIAILALVLVPLLGSVSHGLKTVRMAKTRSVAFRLAQDKMAEIEMLPVPDAEGTESGDFGDEYPDYRWEIEAIKSPELQEMETYLPSLVAMEVHLSVFWQEGEAEKSIRLSTLLMGTQ